MSKRKILGLTETITIQAIGEETNNKAEIIARIDTGATLSSIDINLAEELGIGPVIREKTVKSASGRNVRPVVKAKITIKGETIEGEFSLANREQMKYPVLIGQNHLKKGLFLIDPLIQ